jgi:hypothetical protein
MYVFLQTGFEQQLTRHFIDFIEIYEILIIICVNKNIISAV